MKLNILANFQICISVPLILNLSLYFVISLEAATGGAL